MEGSGSQYNYLIDEDQTIGKDGKNAHGPNTVISILHHHFKNHAMGENSAVLHCDNCPGICNIISYSCSCAFRKFIKVNAFHLHVYAIFINVFYFLFARNTGQNRNKYVTGYLLLRVMIGLHRTIEIHMQIPGHTKCQVDEGFAQIKKKYRR